MWLGRENEENVARTRNCCGWPSSPPWALCPDGAILQDKREDSDRSDISEQGY